MMGKGARPQVMDFGLARLGTDPNASIMSEGSIVGTPSFMAPEQARGQKDAVGPRSDQDSVGVLLYVMLCGKTPYSGEPWSIVSKVADPVVLPDPPRKIRSGVPRDLEACCLKAMEKAPDRRLVVPESDVALRCWDVTSGKTIWELPCGSDCDFELSADRKRVAVANRRRVMQLDAETGAQIGPDISHPNLVYDVKYDASGERILTGCADQFARVFEAESGDLIQQMRHGDMVHRVQWFPDRQSCVTVHWKADLIRVWKLGERADDSFATDLPGGVMHVKWSQTVDHLPGSTGKNLGPGHYDQADDCDAGAAG